MKSSSTVRFLDNVPIILWVKKATAKTTLRAMFQPQWIPLSQQKREKKPTQQSHEAAGSRDWTEAARIIHIYFYTLQSSNASWTNIFSPKQSPSQAYRVSSIYPEQQHIFCRFNQNQFIYEDKSECKYYSNCDVYFLFKAWVNLFLYNKSNANKFYKLEQNTNVEIYFV